MTRTKLPALFLTLTACTQPLALSTAIETKAGINDRQAELWEAAGCDLALGGLDSIDVELRELLIERCAGIDVRPIEKFEVGR